MDFLREKEALISPFFDVQREKRGKGRSRWNAHLWYAICIFSYFLCTLNIAILTLTLFRRTKKTCLFMQNYIMQFQRSTGLSPIINFLMQLECYIHAKEL